MASNTVRPVRALSDAQLDQFVQDGFVRLDNAFPRRLAEEGRAILWRDTGCDSRDRKTWTRPVIRLGYYGQEPFRKAVNTPLLDRDQHVAELVRRPRADLGSFAVRFPHADDPGDTGWHVDLSFPGLLDDPNERDDFSAWRVNVTSRDRALLMLFLFSDIGELDAPTRMRVGSHLDMARLLKPAGEAGMSHLMLSGVAADRPEALAVGKAGTVYLCHPFLIHAAQPHRGSTPRFMAQPPLHPAEPVRLEREDGDYSPVEMAIRRALLEDLD